jgi:hypothetical protein
MKKIIYKIGALIVLMIIVMPSSHALAVDPVDNSYTVLAPLPGTYENCNAGTGEPLTNCKTTLEKYLPGVFNLAIGLAAVAAVLNIVIGGFQYMSTDAIMKKEDGKKRIQNAIYGLVLVIAAWLILWTINPALLTLNLNIEPTKVDTTAKEGTLGDASAPGVRMSDEQVGISNAFREILKKEGVLTYTGPCVNGQATGCVNLNGITNTTLNGLELLKLGCGCDIVITGGTESGVHAAGGSHSTGEAIDLRPTESLNEKLGFPSPKEGNKVTKVFVENGKTITEIFTYEALGGNAGGTSTGDHWHVTFK